MALGTMPLPAKRTAALLLAAGVLTAAVPGPTIGCGYDANIGGGIGTAHAASIGVALAVRSAIEAGRLAPLAEAPAPLALIRANGSLRTFAALLDQAPAGTPVVAVVLVEAHLWGRMLAGPAGTRFEAHVNGPTAGDAIVVTSEPVLRALLDGKLRWDDAVAAGLVVVDASSDGRERLARLLAQRLA